MIHRVGFKKLFFTKSCLFICYSSNSPSLKLTVSSKSLQNAGLQIQAFCALSCRLKVENKIGKICTTAAYWASRAGIWYQGCRGALRGRQPWDGYSWFQVPLKPAQTAHQPQKRQAGLKEISKCLHQPQEAGHSIGNVAGSTSGQEGLQPWVSHAEAAVGNPCQGNCIPKALGLWILL